MVNPAILLALDFKNFVNVTIVTSALKVKNKKFKKYAFVISLVSYLSMVRPHWIDGCALFPTGRQMPLILTEAPGG